MSTALLLLRGGFLHTLNAEQKKRLKHLKSKVILYLFIGILYFFLVLITKWRIPCVFYTMIHKYCPGCGLTRMFMALGRLNFPLAFRSNAFVLTILPIGLVWGIYRGAVYVKQGNKPYSKAESIGLILVFLIAVVFTILRNLDGFSWLLPMDY